MREKLVRAGFQVERLGYFNAPGILGWWVTGVLLRRKTLSRNQVRLFDLLVPLFRLEGLLRLPFGLSLIATGRKA